MIVHCRECQHEWEVYLPLPLPMKRAVAILRGASAAGCARCGASGMNVLCGPAGVIGPSTTTVRVDRIKP